MAAVVGVLALPTAAASAAGAEPAPQYAALGDSYSSGEAAPPFDLSEDCHRSSRAWPALAAAVDRLAIVNLACSGARTADVVGASGGRVAQVAALAALLPRPRVVSLTIGGNDAGFGPVLSACVKVNCKATGVLAAAEAHILFGLPDELLDTYRAVAGAAPDARLVVVGYPHLVPDSAAGNVTCSWLTESERKGLNRATDLLNLVILVQAWRAGAIYVDVSTALAGHDLCSSDPWLVPVGQPGVDPRFYAHPNPDGQRAIAARVAPVLAAAAR